MKRSRISRVFIRLRQNTLWHVKDPANLYGAVGASFGLKKAFVLKQNKNPNKYGKDDEDKTNRNYRRLAKV